jgi:hypothetical protein
MYICILKRIRIYISMYVCIVMYIYIDGRIVSAGAGNKISVWRSGRERSEDWSLHKWFDTEEAGNIVLTARTYLSFTN